MTSQGKRRAAALVAAGAIASVLAGVGPALAQEDVRKEIEELKKGQQQILQQLQELRQMLQAAPARPGAVNVKDVVFNLGTNPTQGSDKATLTLIEFTDYQ